MFGLALVNTIWELTAWKRLGAQCFLRDVITEAEHRGSHSGLRQILVKSKSSADQLHSPRPRQEGETSAHPLWAGRHAWGSSLAPRTQPRVVSSAVLPVGSHCWAVLFSYNTCGKRPACTSRPSLDPLGCAACSPPEFVQGNAAFSIWSCLWSGGAKVQSN